MTKLVLQNVRKVFGDFTAVEGLSLEIDEGETVALLGPSGCGKSTTLNMIVGLESPTSGDILIDGKSVVDVPPGKRNIGLVFQDYAVFTHLTVRQNLAFGLRSQGMPRAEIDKKIDEVAELVDLGDVMSRSTKVLGGSELQRVALARTLVTNPSILLLDEPLSNLEAEMRAQMRRELRRIQGETRQTIIYVTHDQIEALSLAHRIAVMDQGKLQHYGTAHEVYHRPANRFVGRFLGNPPMNMISGRLNRVKDGAAVEFLHGSIRLPEKYSGLAEMAGREVNLGHSARSIVAWTGGEWARF